MSSIIIHNYEKPDRCIACPLFSGNGCRATMRLFPKMPKVTDVHENCPMEELVHCEDCIYFSNSVCSKNAGIFEPFEYCSKGIKK